MKPKTNKKIFFLLALFFLTFAFQIQAADTNTGLVPCGLDSTYANRCTLCHLIVGIRDIIDWGKTILIVVALVAIVAGAIMYIVSAGNNTLMEAAKNVIKQALWGVVIVLGAWVIVNTALWLITSKLNDSGSSSQKFLDISSWNDFQCTGGGTTPGTVDPVSKPLNADGSCPSGYHKSSSGTLCIEDDKVTNPDIVDPDTTDPDTTNPDVTNPDVINPDTAANDVSKLDEDGTRSYLNDHGITVNKGACTAGQTSGCTDTDGLRENTINGVVLFKEECGASCNVVVTGGSEGNGIHSERGTYNHINGYKVDIRTGEAVDNYITNNYTKIPTRSDGATGYIDSSGNKYYKEGDHWDITYI
ncbi:MAG: pilin [Parcubacteria group bacterium]|jgi:hypothetical protein